MLIQFSDPKPFIVLVDRDTLEPVTAVPDDDALDQELLLDPTFDFLMVTERTPAAAMRHVRRVIH
jgi:hypothetical protein